MLARRRRVGKRTFDERARVFLAFHDRVLERQDEALDWIQLESGKARLHAFEEVADVAIVARYYAVHAADFLAPQSRKGAIPGLTESREYRHPKGVVGIIAPWNYPLVDGDDRRAFPPFSPATRVVEKPDSQTPFTTLWALDLLIECGLPEGLWQVVCGDGPTLGPAIFDAVDYVQFTGSTDDREARRRARPAQRLVGCSLELGGKNPMLVLADADLGSPCRGAVRGCFASAGQLCVSVERLFVHDVGPRPLRRRDGRRDTRRSASAPASTGATTSAR